MHRRLLDRVAVCGSYSVFSLLLVGILAGCTAIDTGLLLGEMTDLDRLAVLPSPAYTTGQFSSYDRKSTTPDDYETWFANRDRGHHLRAEEVDGRREYVMMDAEGPGAVLRIWSANPEGTLRIYLDGSDEPALEEDMKALLGGDVPGIPEPFAGVRARGYNLYFPIPYARHCKITTDERNIYYLVNFRTYTPGTNVRTFRGDDLTRWADTIARMGDKIADPHEAGAPKNVATRDWSVSLEPGAEEAIARLDGPAQIARFAASLSADDIEAAARGIVLQIDFDGQTTVETPLGDFFGTAPGLSPYESLPVGIAEGSPPRMWSHWRMPFQRSAVVTLRNLSEQPVTLEGTLGVGSYRWTDRSLLFHAKWRIERDLPSRPFTDWTHMICQGQGRFVGSALHIANPVLNWWGEGDEKIYVDGETFPSWFGTGTEDYYGYAWCNDSLFEHAYHNQTRVDGPRNYGNTSNNRFHVIDDIPFTRSFKFDMENWHSNDNTTTTRAAVSYWYARPGGTDFFEPLTADDVAPAFTPPYAPFYAQGAIEGEDMRIVEITAGDAAVRGVISNAFSGDKTLLWGGGKPGDTLTLAFDVPQAGHRNVIVCMAGFRDFGIVRLSINGMPADPLIDLYQNRFQPVAEVDLGVFLLRDGENHLTIEIVGANEEAEQNYGAAIDYLRLE
jgi:hypothetical protein